MKIAILGMLAALGILSVREADAETASVGSAADTTAPIMAVWVEREIYFPYIAYTSYYSCDGLKMQVSSILKAIGVRPGFKVTPRGCFNPRRGAEWTPSLEIIAAMPRAATPEVLAELAKDASRRELAAKAGGKVASTTEATAEFPARARRIDFRDSQLGLLQPGDCDLIDQMRDKVFVPLGAKIVADDMACFRHTVNYGAIVLSIEVLEPVLQE